MTSVKRLAWFVLPAALTGALARADDEGERVYRNTLKSTVWIIAGNTTGTGSVVDARNRLVVTNQHVVEGKTEVNVLLPLYENGRVVAERNAYLKNARPIRAKVIAVDAKRDLAVLQLSALPAGIPALPLAADSAGPGQRVHSIGNPSVSGALWVYTSGTVRQVYRRSFKLRDGREVEARVVETQSPINSGDSGGPVVNDKGELVAVVQSYEASSARLVSTFIDVSEVRAVLGGAGAAPTTRVEPDAGDRPTTPAPTTGGGALLAEIVEVKQEHNYSRDGRKGLALHVHMMVRNGKGKTGEVVAVIADTAGKPLSGKKRAYSNSAGELCTFGVVSPGYDNTLYRDLVLFIPYDEVTAEPGRQEFRYLVNVWCGDRWIADKPVWGAFLINRPQRPADEPRP